MRNNKTCEEVELISNNKDTLITDWTQVRV